MARFGDNPIKYPLAGNEVIPATDPITGDDIGLTPDGLGPFIADILTVVNGSNQGIVSVALFNRWNDTYTKEQVDAFNLIFIKEPIGFFIGTVANGYIEFFCNVLTALTIVSGKFKTGSGTVNCTVQINGVSVTGMTGIACSSTMANATATASRTVNPGDRIGLLFDTNAAALNFYVTLLTNKSLV